MAEIWRAVSGWCGFYEVSNAGRVRSLDRFIHLVNRFGKPETRRQRGQMLKTSPSKNGYPMVSFTAPGGVREYRYVHHLVAAAFLAPAKPGEEICHRDGNKMNCRSDNLRFGTRSSNALDRHEHGTMNQARGEDHHLHKLTADDVNWIRNNRGLMSQRDMGDALGVTHGVIGLVQRREAWKHVA